MEALLLVHNSDESAVLKLAFQRLGLSVKIVTDLSQIVANWQNYVADVIVLTFPKRELPINTIRQVRAFTDVPLVVICEQQVEESLVNLFDAGVDLVVFRPFSARVLMAQLRALFRRFAGSTEGIPFFSLPVLARGDIIVNPSERTVQVNQGSPKRLTQLEFRLLYALMNHAGQTISAEQLVEYVWGYNGRGDRNLVRGLIKRLRAKIEPCPEEPRYILTVTGMGYMLNP